MLNFGCLKNFCGCYRREDVGRGGKLQDFCKLSGTGKWRAITGIYDGKICTTCIMVYLYIIFGKKIK